MACLSRSGWPSLIALFLVLVSLFNYATSLPLPDEYADKALVERTQTLITQK
jgi:hypothetical protein